MKSKLEELIEKFCPNGAEYRELGEVCKFQNGFAFKSSKFLEKGLPIVRIANIVDGKISENNLIYFDKNDYNINLDSYIIKKDRIVIAMSGATTGKIGYNYSEIEFYLNQRVGMFIPKEEKLNNRFLYHWLIGQSNNIYNISSGTGAQPNLSSTKMMKLEIPIPPLEIQEEIVRILDKFTELITKIQTELATELTLRKLQYEHYRDKLLTFEKVVEWKKIKEVFERLKGTPITATKMKEIASEKGEITVIAGGKTIIKACEKDIPNSNIISVPAVLVQSRGIIDVLYLEEKFTFKNEMWAYTTDNKITVKYLYYILKKNIAHLRQVAQGTGALPQISLTVTEDLKIPLPPLEEQKRIVEVLDKFQKLINEAGGLLPEEIENRKKQYKYYREKLLTFEEKCDRTNERTNERTLTLTTEFFKLLEEAEATVGIVFVNSLEWKNLGEVLKIKNGKDYKKYDTGEIPVYGSGGVIAYIDTFVFDKASVLIPRKGSIDKLYYVDKPFWTVDTIFYTEIKENMVIPKFIFYYLQKEHLEKYNTAGGVPSLTQSVLNKISLPVPPLEEQKRIVEILDRFDKYINDIKEGLPAEIEMRQKQYEYYRDKLLNFKKLNSEG